MKKTSEIIKDCIKALRGETNPFNIPIYDYALELQENIPKVDLHDVTEQLEALHNLVMVHEKKIYEAYKLLSPSFLINKKLKNKLEKLDINALSNLINIRPVVKLNIITTAGLIYSLAWLKGHEYAPLEFPQEEGVKVKADLSNFHEEPNFMNIVRNFLNLLRDSNKAEISKIIRGGTWEETVRKFMAFTFLIDGKKIKIISEGDKKFLKEA